MKMTRSQIINLFIEKRSYKSYLEIGVNTPKQPGYNWDNINVEVKHGVDPAEKTKATYVMTSDEFFAKHINRKYDIVFVDGLHIFDQAYRDIVNSLKHLNEGGVIVVHDCNPLLEKTQTPVHTSGAWHGDVWKAILKLRSENPNLSIYTIDTDEGCGIIEKGHQKLLKLPPNKEEAFTFNFLNRHRKEVLNLISVGQFKKKMGIKSKITRLLEAASYRFGPKHRKSYSQCGEDLIVARLLRDMKIDKPFYMDIGANDPVVYNNTYLFYKNGGRGILIEPDLDMCMKTQAKRPADLCLRIGIGTSDGEKNFYVLDNNSLSTFSKSEADAAVAKGHKIIKTIQVRIKTLATIMKERGVKQIDFLSLDVEGLDFEILKSIDFNLIRPSIICVETKNFTDTQDQSPVVSFMQTKGYKLAGSTPINSIFTI